MEIKFAGAAHETAETHLTCLIGYDVTWRVRTFKRHPGDVRTNYDYLTGQGKIVDVDRSVDGWLYVVTQETVNDFETYDGGLVTLVFDDTAQHGFDYDSYHVEVH